MKSLVLSMLISSLLCLSNQCMEQKQTNNIKSLQALAGEVVCKNGLFHKIQLSELKHQVQLTRELSGIGELFSLDADYEKLLSFITNYNDTEKLKYFYLVECFGDLHTRIVKTCADSYYELLWIYLMNGHLLINEPRNEHDVLMRAAVLGDEESLTNAIAFVDSGKLKKIINQQYEAFGALPLVEASRRGLLGNVAQLLKLGADINAQDGCGKTALIAAALNGHLELIKMLLAHGAWFTAEDNRKLTALSGAILKGHTKVVAYLLEHDNDVSESVELEIKTFYHPWMLAIRSMDPEILEIVFSHLSPSPSSINEMLIVAAQMGNTYAVKLLLSKDAKVNYFDAQQLPLGVACSQGTSEIVHLLLDYGADINQKDIHGDTALMRAARRGHKNIVKLLIEHGALVNLANNFGTTAIMNATIGGHATIIELLVNYGASLDIPAIDDNTALTLACQFRDTEVVALILRSGVQVDHINRAGETALMIAAQKGEKEIVELLLSYNAEVNNVCHQNMTALLYAVKHCNNTCIEPLLKAGAEVNKSDNNGSTPLMNVAQRNDVSLVQLLLDYGADIRPTNHWGQTVESIAAETENLALIELINAKKTE